MSKCRICLSEDNVLDVYDKDLKGSKDLRYFLSLSSGITISENDQKSRKICHKCCLVAINLYKYRTNAMKIDKALKEEAKRTEDPQSTPMQFALPIKTEPKSPTREEPETSHLPSSILKQPSENTWSPRIVNVRSLSKDTTNENCHSSVNKILKKNPGLLLPQEVLRCDVNPEVWLGEELQKQEEVDRELELRDQEIQVSEIKQELITISDDDDDKSKVFRLGNILVKRVETGAVKKEKSNLAEETKKLEEWVKGTRGAKRKSGKGFTGPLSVKKARLRAEAKKNEKKTFSGPLSVKISKMKEDNKVKREQESDSSSESEKYRLKCPVCSKTFYERSKLNLHRRQHPICLLCNKKLLNLHDLSRHLKKSCPIDIINSSPIVRLPRIDHVKSIVERYKEAFKNPPKSQSDSDDCIDPLDIEHVLLPKPSDNLIQENYVEEVLGLQGKPINFWMSDTQEEYQEPETATPVVLHKNPNPITAIKRSLYQESSPQIPKPTTSDVVCISDDDERPMLQRKKSVSTPKVVLTPKVTCLEPSSLPAVLKPSVRMIGAEDINKEGSHKDAVIKKLFERYERKVLDTSKMQQGMSSTKIFPTRIVDTPSYIEFVNLMELLEHEIVPIHFHNSNRLVATYTSKLTGPAPHTQLFHNHSSRKWSFSISTSPKKQQLPAQAAPAVIIPQSPAIPLPQSPAIPLPQSPAIPLPQSSAVVPPAVTASSTILQKFPTNAGNYAEIMKNMIKVGGAPNFSGVPLAVGGGQVGMPGQFMIVPQMMGQSPRILVANGGMVLLQNQLMVPPVVQPRPESSVRIEEIPSGSEEGNRTEESGGDAGKI